MQYIELEWFEDRARAEAAERYAIRRERPEWNIRGMAEARKCKVTFEEDLPSDLDILLKGLWHSPMCTEDHAIERASDRVGAKVDRNWMNARCGPRSGSQAKAKRVAMCKKLNNQEPET